MANLVSALSEEITRCELLLKEYESVLEGAFGAVLLRASITQGKKALREGDTILMIKAYNDLKSTE